LPHSQHILWIFILQVTCQQQQSHLVSSQEQASAIALCLNKKEIWVTEQLLSLRANRLVITNWIWPFLIYLLAYDKLYLKDLNYLSKKTLRHHKQF
jgi:hypothetical protein